jgi:tryptophanyl-tRNA synthetase
MSATTDDKGEVHFDREHQPGISNLLEILALLRGEQLETVVKEFDGQTKYGEFKAVVADEVKAFLTDFQARLGAIDDAVLSSKLSTSETAMKAQANARLHAVQVAIGLRAKE